LTLFIFGVVLASLAIFLKLKIKKLKKEGFKVGPKMNALLFKKSIFDIYSDIIYFPVITKVIGAFLRPAISKPHP
jgi:vacuolar-type H+-ATPase subunit I/STV1